MRKVICFVLSMFVFSNIHAQVLASTAPWNDSISNGVVYLSNTNMLNADTLFINNKSSFGLGVNDVVSKVFDYVDNYGVNRIGYNQIHKGYPVANSEYIYARKQGRKPTLAGGFISGLNVNVSGIINTNQLNLVINSIIQNKSLYQPPSYTTIIAGVLSDDSYKLYYKVNIVYDDLGQNIDYYIDAITGNVDYETNNNFHFTTNACTSHYGSQSINVVLNNDSTIKINDTCIKYNVNDKINYNNKVLLLDTTRNVKISVNYRWDYTDTFYNFRDSTYDRISRSKSHMGYDENVNIGNLGCNSNSPAALKYGNEALWIAGNVISKMQRIGYRLSDSFSADPFLCDPTHKMAKESLLNIDLFSTEMASNNALYILPSKTITIYRKMENPQMEISSNDPEFMVSADVLAHEMGHMYFRNFMQKRNYWDYTRIRGAIEEGFGDIVGAYMERYLYDSFNTGKVKNWTAGEDLGVNLLSYYGDKWKSHFRDLKNPAVHNMPDHLQSRFWKSPTPTCCQQAVNENDNCYIHTNCSIFTKWFQLMVDGGYHETSPYQYYIPAVPIDSVMKLVMYTVIHTVPADIESYNSLHELMRTNLTLIFSPSVASNYLTSVNNAWYSLGVNTPASISNVEIEANKTYSDYTFPLSGEGYTPNNFAYPYYNFLIENKNIVLKGDFELNTEHSLTFKNCNFIIAKDAKIRIMPNSKEVFENCVFSTFDYSSMNCGSTNRATKTWKGIEILPTGAGCIDKDMMPSNVNFVNCFFENAENAIASGAAYYCDHLANFPRLKVQYASNIIVKKSMFQNCRTDIDYNKSEYIVNNLEIDECSFITSNAQIFTSNPKTRSVLLGQSVSNPNKLSELYNHPDFQYLGYPPFRNPNPIIIKNSVFYNYDQTTVSYTGIELKYNTLNDTLASYSFDSNYFFKINKAIDAKASYNLDVKGNKFQDCRYGIASNNHRQIIAQNNNFTNNEYAIDVRNSLSGIGAVREYTLIENNEFLNTNTMYGGYKPQRSIYLSKNVNTTVKNNAIKYNFTNSGAVGNGAIAALHIVGGSNHSVVGNSFSKEMCEGWPRNNCIKFQHTVPAVFESTDNESAFFVNNTISDWWTRGLQARSHNRGLRIKCNDFFPTIPPDHTAIYVDSGELRNQGMTVDIPDGCTDENLPVANRYLYRSNSPLHDNCTYTSLPQHVVQGISPNTKQIVLKNANLSTGYQLRYYTQSVDGVGAFTPTVTCHTLAKLSVINCPSGSDAYEIKPSTCSEANLYTGKLLPPGAKDESTNPCEHLITWKDYRMGLLSDIRTEALICPENMTTRLFETQDVLYQKYLNIIETDAYIRLKAQPCSRLWQYEDIIAASSLATPKYALIDKQLNEPSLARAATTLNTLSQPALEEKIMCGARLQHFRTEHEYFLQLYRLQYQKEWNRRNNQSTLLDDTELALLHRIRTTGSQSGAKAEALLTQYADISYVHPIPSYTYTALEQPTDPAVQRLLPLVLFPNPNKGNFNVGMEIAKPYRKARILVYRTAEAHIPVYQYDYVGGSSYLNHPVSLQFVFPGVYTAVLYLDEVPYAGANFMVEY